MTAGIPNTAYVVGKRKNTGKPIPVVPQSRIKAAQILASKLKKQK